MKIEEIRPIFARVLIEIAEPIEKLESGIFIPISKDDKKMRGEGTVVACGPDVKDIKPGDVVRYPVNIGHSFKLSKKEYLIAEEKGLLCTIS